MIPSWTSTYPSPAQDLPEGKTEGQVEIEPLARSTAPLQSVSRASRAFEAAARIGQGAAGALQVAHALRWIFSRLGVTTSTLDSYLRLGSPPLRERKQ